jgi:hypothetical protein
MDSGGKGSFQAVKLQRPARTTVCSHSTRDMTAMRSIESKQDDNDTQGRVSVQLWTVIKWGRERTSGRHVLAGHLRHGYGRLLQSKMRNEMETADFEFVPKQMQNALLREL